MTQKTNTTFEPAKVRLMIRVPEHGCYYAIEKDDSGSPFLISAPMLKNGGIDTTVEEEVN